jgi:hypothetical protein
MQEFMRSFLFYRMPLFFTLFGISACTYFPENDSGLSSITSYDTSVDFTRYKSFAINDSIGYLQLKQHEITGKITPVVVYKKDPKTDIIVASVIDKLTQYCRYPDQLTDKLWPTPPDLIIDLLYMDVAGNHANYADWWSFHRYWHSYLWYDHYPYYPYYPITTGTAAQGVLIMDMKDLTDITMVANVNWKDRIPVPVVWVGMVSGLNGTFNDTMLNDAIEDCFIQTDAFKKNKK